MNNWDEHYISGNFTNWDLLYPSQELVAFIATMTFPRKKVALDVGCGAGREAIFLAQQGWDVIGVDLSTEALRIAAERAKDVGVEVDWRQGDILNLPVKNKFIDFVNDRGCFHSIVEENRDQYVKEIARTLKPGGMMLLRGCRDEEEEGHFVLVTETSVDRYFSQYFDRGPVLPLQMVTGRGYSHEGMKGNLVVLKKNRKYL
jgi:ubiquinone/menaquinone biosynthesis C-methylase UbiE